jgi:hypothetical protein
MIDATAAERHLLCEQYQALYEQTLHIEERARIKDLKPSQLDPHYSQLCHELETVTLKLSRLKDEPLRKPARS